MSNHTQSFTSKTRLEKQNRVTNLSIFINITNDELNLEKLQISRVIK